MDSPRFGPKPVGTQNAAQLRGADSVSKLPLVTAMLGLPVITEWVKSEVLGAFDGLAGVNGRADGGDGVAARNNLNRVGLQRAQLYVFVHILFE